MGAHMRKTSVCTTIDCSERHAHSVEWRSASRGGGRVIQLSKLWTKARSAEVRLCANRYAQKACRIPENPRGRKREASFDPCQSHIRIPREVLKGVSHLRAPNHCRRYRPAVCHREPVDTSTGYVGFRCIVRAGRDA